VGASNAILAMDISGWGTGKDLLYFNVTDPLGNSNHLNVYNNNNPREGYKDNRPEYFFAANADAHRQFFANAGVIGLFFGPGVGGMSFYTNDVYTDGQLFMKSRAGVVLNSGGLVIQ
jgi:hypothetical protein